MHDPVAIFTLAAALPTTTAARVAAGGVPVRDIARAIDVPLATVMRAGLVRWTPDMGRDDIVDRLCLAGIEPQDAGRIAAAGVVEHTIWPACVLHTDAQACAAAMLEPLNGVLSAIVDLGPLAWSISLGGDVLFLGPTGLGVGVLAHPASQALIIPTPLIVPKVVAASTLEALSTALSLLCDSRASITAIIAAITERATLITTM